jgi:hypothetical protein
MRCELDDGAATTVHVARHRRESTTVRVVSIPMQPLAGWCAEQRISDAIVGGFFIRAAGVPLGDLWIGGRRHRSEPFTPPYGAQRSCVQICDGEISIAGRHELPPRPAGDLLQAGPRLVREGRAEHLDGNDPEGFSTGAGQFDSDITVGRYPRAALGISDEELIAVVCDGRSDTDSGMTLAELAALMRGLGAREAINLDGGGSASLIAGGVLRNCPREEHGLPLDGGRAVSTALTFQPI